MPLTFPGAPDTTNPSSANRLPGGARNEAVPRRCSPIVSSRRFLNRCGDCAAGVALAGTPVALLINLSMIETSTAGQCHLGPLTNSFLDRPQDHFQSFHSITQSAREDPAIPRATERHPLIVQICTGRCAILRQRPRIDLTFAHSWVTRFARLVYRGREDRTREKTAAERE